MLKIPSRTLSSASRYCCRTGLVTALILAGGWCGLPSAIAASAAPGVLENKATGSFETEGSGTETAIESNTVTLIVAEVAGVTVTAANTPSVLVGGTYNFLFTITNVGNDPTQFYIPGAPSSIVGGTAGTLKIVAYDADGSGAAAAVDLTANNINVPGGGATTGTLLGTISVANNGVIPAGASIVVQIPVTVTANAGSPVSVTLGNTSGQPSDSNTTYVVGANGSGTNDLYTVDNADGTAGETPGAPINGDAINHRQEASATNSVIVSTLYITVSGTVFRDADADVIINDTDAGTNTGSSSLTIYAIDTTGKVIDKTSVGNDGVYSLTAVPASSSVKLRLSNDATVVIGATAPSAPSLPPGWFHTGKNINSVVDGTIATLGEISLNTTTSNLTLHNFGIRQSYVLPAAPVPTICAANFTTSLNTGISSSGAKLLAGTIDPNWTVEWLAGPTGYALPRPVGAMPAVVTGNLASGAWVNAPTGVEWISYPFRLTTNSNGNHRDANLDGNPNQANDTVRLKFTAKITLPANASSIAITMPVGVSVDNEFVSLKVNGVENLKNPPSPPQPQTEDYRIIQNEELKNGWQAGVNTIEVVVDSGPDRVGFFLAVQATSTQICGNPNVLLVKRITGVNGNTSTLNGQDMATYHQDDANPYDDNLIEPALAPSTSFPRVDTNKWPNTTDKISSTFLIGGTDGGTIRPNDSIEYTIYFLSAGEDTARSVLFCDRVPDNVTFIPTAYNNIPAGSTSALGVERGIAVNLGGDLKSYTNAADNDFAQYFPPGSNPNLVFPKVNCGGNNTNGAVVVNLGNLPQATAPGVPNGSYGFVRFQGRVK